MVSEVVESMTQTKRCTNPNCNNKLYGQQKKYCSMKCRAACTPQTQKGRTFSDETKKRMSKAQRGKIRSKESNLKRSKTMKKWIENMSGEERKKWIKKRYNSPNKIESKLITVINEKKLPFKFVGNGGFMICRFNPDFIHTKGKKYLIEINGNYWHTQKQVEDKTEFYHKEGWKVLNLTYKDVNESNSNLLEVIINNFIDNDFEFPINMKYQKRYIIKKCEFCKKEYQTRNIKQKFCCSKCFYNSNIIERIILQCQYEKCDNIIKVTSYQLQNGCGKYCSRGCKDKSQIKKKQKRYCKMCRKELRKNQRGNIYCSTICSGKALSLKMRNKL